MKNKKLLLIVMTVLLLTNRTYGAEDVKTDNTKTKVAGKKVAIIFCITPLYALFNVFGGQEMDYNIQVNIATSKKAHLNFNYRKISPLFSWGWRSEQVTAGIGYRFMLGATNRKTGVTGLNGFWIGPTLGYFQYRDVYTSCDYCNTRYYTIRAITFGVETGHQWVFKSGFTLGWRVGARVGFTQAEGFGFLWFNTIVGGLEFGWSF